MRDSTAERMSILGLALMFSSLPWNVSGSSAAAGAAVDPTAPPRLVVQISSEYSTSIAYSPTGRHALTGGREGVVRLWDVETGKLIRSLNGHRMAVMSMAITADGRRALTGSDDGEAKLWDLEKGELIRPLVVGDEGYITAVAIARDGRHGLTGSWNGKARLWDLETGKPLQSIQERANCINLVAISPDARRALISTVDDTARLWDLETGKLVRVLKGHTGEILALAITPDGRHALTGGKDKTARLWDLETGKEIRSLQGQGNDVWTVAITPDGRHALTGHLDMTAHLWDLASGTHLRTIRAEYGTVIGAAISPDGRRALILCASGPARLWDLGKETPIRSLQGQVYPVSGVAIAPDGRRSLTTSTSRPARLWDLEKGEMIRSLGGFREETGVMAIAPDSRHVLTIGLDKKIRLCDVETGKTIDAIEWNGGQLESMAITRDCRHALITDTDKTAWLWDVAAATLSRSLERYADPHDSARQLAITIDGRRGLLPDRNEAKFIELKSGKLICLLPGIGDWIQATTISRDGRRALTGTADKTVRLWDLETGKLLRSFDGHEGSVTAVAFSPDGRRALTGSGDRTARLWDLEKDDPIQVLRGHASGVTGVAFTPDGQNAMTSSEDGTTAVWRLDDGRELCRLLSFEDGTWAVVDPSGRYDSSNGGRVDGLHWVIGMEPIDLDQLKDRYYDPGLLAKHMRLSKEPLRTVAGLGSARLYPETSLAKPDPGDPRGTLGITLTDRGGGIGKVVVKINGKEIAANALSAPDADPRPDVARLALPLAGDPRLIPGGDNRVEVTAYNADGSLSSRGAVVVYRAGGPSPQPSPELWAVVVGTADYIGTEIDLRFAAKDAEAFSRALEVASDRLLTRERVHIRTLSTDRPDAADRPSKANIEAAFKQTASRARPTDLLVVYFSGHGVAPQGDDEYYYLTADARSLALDDAEVRRRDALSGAELAELIRAVPATGKQVLILDTCAAGQGIKVLGRRRAVSGDQVRALERIKDRNGLHLLAGSTADASSYEASRYGQGLLTYSLLLGMTGPGLKGTELDVLTWFGYAVDEVPQLARGIGGVQRPQLSSPREGASFPIGRIEPEDRAKIALRPIRPLIQLAEFQEEKQFDDVLGLASRVDNLLRDASDKGDAHAPVVVDAREGEGAFRLRGRYRIDGPSVEAIANLFQGNAFVTRVSARGAAADPDALARSIVEELNKILLKY